MGVCTQRFQLHLASPLAPDLVLPPDPKGRMNATFLFFSTTPRPLLEERGGSIPASSRSPTLYLLAKHMGCHLGRAPKRCPHPLPPRRRSPVSHDHTLDGLHLPWECGGLGGTAAAAAPSSALLLPWRWMPPRSRSERASKRERPVAGRGWGRRRRRRRDGDRAGVRGLLPTTPRSPEQPRERRRARRATPPPHRRPPGIPVCVCMSLSRFLKRPELGSPPPTAGILATGARAGPSPLSGAERWEGGRRPFVIRGWRGGRRIGSRWLLAALGRRASAVSRGEAAFLPLLRAGLAKNSTEKLFSIQSFLVISLMPLALRIVLGFTIWINF